MLYRLPISRHERSSRQSHGQRDTKRLADSIVSVQISTPRSRVPELILNGVFIRFLAAPRSTPPARQRLAWRRLESLRRGWVEFVDCVLAAYDPGMVTVEAPVDMVESVASLCLPEKADRQLQSLMDRNTNGELNPAEREELAALVELSERMSLLRARALRVLGRSPQ